MFDFAYYLFQRSHNGRILKTIECHHFRLATITRVTNQAVEVIREIVGIGAIRIHVFRITHNQQVEVRSA